MSDTSVDVAVVGGGIVGLATAHQLLVRFRGLRVVVLEKEAEVASHQTGRNSGVIHSGIYYRPGSLKARICREGARLLVDFCRAHGIAYEICGKVIIATDETELPRLQALYEQGTTNEVRGLTLIGPDRLREIEPHATGLRALYVPGAGIVDFRGVSRALAREVGERGGEIRTGCRVLRLTQRDDGWVLRTTRGEVSAGYVVTCAGLHADRLAAAAGAAADMQIVPFRGEYYELVPSRRDLVRHLIYPVPDPSLPFLGVHLTRGIDGGVHAGPNAVLALKREGYRKTDVSLNDVGELVRFPGFWAMARRYWRVGIEEAHRSLSKRAFVRALQRLVPEIREADLVPAASGVRAQAVDRDGRLLSDFDIVQQLRAIHVRNAPSPAATASLAIGQAVAEMAGRMWSGRFALDVREPASLPS